MLTMKPKLVVLLMLWGASFPTYGAPVIEELEKSLVEVIVQSGNSEHRSVGVVVGGEKVLAIAPEKMDSAQFSVSPWSGTATLVASPQPLGEDYPFLVLTVSGLETDAATFSGLEPTEGQVVYSPLAGDAAHKLKKGALAEGFELQPEEGLLIKKAKGPLLQLVSHNALVPADHYGAPLYNECGDVIALSIADPRLDKDDRRKDPKETMVAVRAMQVLQWLDEADLAVDITEEQCLSADEKAALAEQQAQEAERQAQEAEHQAQEAASEAEEAQRQLEEMEQDANAAQEQVQEAEAELARLQEEASASEEEIAAAQEAVTEARSELEAAQEETESLRREIERIKEEAQQEKSRLMEQIKLYGGIAAGVLALVLLLWGINVRAKKKQMHAAQHRAEEAEQKAQEAVAESEARLAPFDCVLDGQDKSGKRHLLKLHKQALGDPDGVILGRNPRNATFIISHEEIGREHARLYVRDGVLYAEDLASVNGTRVNGKPLPANESAPLVDGSTLEIGPLSFNVQLVS